LDQRTSIANLANRDILNADNSNKNLNLSDFPSHSTPYQVVSTV